MKKKKKIKSGVNEESDNSDLDEAQSNDLSNGSKEEELNATNGEKESNCKSDVCQHHKLIES